MSDMQGAVEEGLPTPPAEDDSREWTSEWVLNEHTRTWERRYLHRHFKTGALTDTELVHKGPMHRPGVLRDVVHLNVPLVSLKSHPDTPGVMPEEHEGMWISTNPAWPEMSVTSHLGSLGLVADFKGSVPPQYEEFDGLSAVVIFARDPAKVS